MNIKVNGKFYEMEDNITLEKVVENLKISNKNIVGEVNGELVRREDFSRMVIYDGYRIELIKFVGGG